MESVGGSRPPPAMSTKHKKKPYFMLENGYSIHCAGFVSEVVGVRVYLFSTFPSQNLERGFHGCNRWVEPDISQRQVQKNNKPITIEFRVVGKSTRACANLFRIRFYRAAAAATVAAVEPSRAVDKVKLIQVVKAVSEEQYKLYRFDKDRREGLGSMGGSLETVDVTIDARNYIQIRRPLSDDET